MPADGTNTELTAKYGRVVDEVVRRLAADAAARKVAAVRRVLSSAFPAPEHRVRFTASDGAGVVRWVTVARCPSVSAAVLRRLDRACALGRPWSEYDALQELLLFPAQGGGLDEGARTRVVVTIRGASSAVVHLEVRGDQWHSDAGRRSARRLLARWGRGASDLAIGAEGSRLQGVKLRLGKSGIADVSLVRGGPLLLDHLPEPLGAVAWDDLAALIATLTAERDGGPSVLSWWVTPPNRPGDRCAIGVELEGIAPPEELLHRARAHLVGYRLCDDLVEGAPQWLEIVLHPAAAPTVAVEARLRLPVPPSAVGIGRPAGSAGPSGIRHAAGRAVDRLLDTQSAGGGWWDLPVSAGASGAWLTAVVGLALHVASSAGIATSTRVARALAAAEAYLRLAELPNGGWGWNEALDADCDSTAHAVLLLARRGGAGLRSVTALRAFQTPDGRFLTYRDAPPGHSWGRLHHDVHPAAVRALAAICGPTDPAVVAGLAHVRAGLQMRPPWPAFWWATSAYGAYVSLRCLEQLGELSSIDDGDRRRLLGCLDMSDLDPLVTALACSVAATIGVPARPLVERLRSTQRPDGGWAARPALRVVVSQVDEPWRPDLAAVAGPLYPEVRGVFATAMALEALVRAGS